MDYNSKKYELLLRSFDEELNAEEQAQLELLLQNGEAWRLEYQKLERLRNSIREREFSLSTGFEDKVLKQLSNTEAKVISLMRFTPQIVAASILVLLLSVVAIYLGEGTLNTASLLGVQDLSPEEAYTLLNY